MSSKSSEKLTSKTIRKGFIEYFKKRNHKFIPSSPVAPLDDPTLLFTNAGMNQFKPIFLGENKRGYTRAVNSQKCIRVSGKHNDLEAVGKDTYHHTFFEMLGNWSFGDYYKEEAVMWAWELLTEVWGIEKDRLFVTVHNSDDEAGRIWAEKTDIAPERIMKFGDKENFWEMGDVGPCGPCSEIHYDTGDENTRAETYADSVKGVNGENDRYIEIWNLVFIQYERLKSGELRPLENKHVDTGMGFERVSAVLQNVSSNYDTDIFKPVIDKISELSGIAYASGPEGMAHRVIADHLRALVFAITDGALPGNEGRGYVLRRILRRGSRFCRELNQNGPFICKLVPVLVEQMKDAFPELSEREEFVTQIIQSEEERFISTLGQGLERFRKTLEGLKVKNQSLIPGIEAFTLYDTYGFPLDLTEMLAGENGMKVDKSGYDLCMREQRVRAGKAAKFDNSLAAKEGWIILNSQTGTRFTGYHNVSGTGNLLRYKEEEGVVYVVLSSTPFYAESGGQLGDTGRIYNDELELEVLDTIKVTDTTIHKCKLVKGGMHSAMNPVLTTEIDGERRNDIKRNHSATHMLQAALRKVLGDHINQTGSRVGPDDLRFDFSHFKPVSNEEINKIEDLVNQKILECLKVWDVECPIEEARRFGAIALFGEKYGDQVRVIHMKEFSCELCGGVHVESTGQIGLFRIISESSIASGVRRIEAITGRGALEFVRQQSESLKSIAAQLKAKPGTESQKVLTLFEHNKKMEKEIEQLQAQGAGLKAETLLSRVITVGEYGYAAVSAGGVGKSEYSALIDMISQKLDKAAVVVTNVQDGSLSIVALVSKNLTNKIKAGDLIKRVSAIADGKGGGRPDRAQAGSKKPEMENEVLKEAEKVLKDALK